MIPFPGESVGVVDAHSTDARGWFLSNEIELRTKRPSVTGVGHWVINDGDEWRCWAYCVSDWAYLEAGDTTPLTVSWVIEVLSGTGTLALRDGHDADWDYDDEATLPNDLGTVSVVGAATYVVDTTTFPDNDDLVAVLNGGTGPANLGIVCTSGSVDISQVKLRVWPTAGPLGGWSADAVTEAAQNIYPAVSNQPTAVIAPDPVWASQDELRDSIAVAEVSSFASPVFSGTNMGGASFEALHTEYDPEIMGNIHQYGASTSFVYLRVTPGNLVGPDGGEGVAWIRPPSEVQDELDEYVFDADGPGSISWLQGIVSWLVSSSSGDGTNYWYAGGSFHVNIQEISDVLASGTPIATYVGSGSPIDSFPSPGAAGPSYVLDSFTMPSVEPRQLYLLTFTHDGFFGDVDEDWDGTFAGGTSALQVYRGNWPTYPDDSPDLLRATWTPEAYRYWDPFAEDIEPEPGFVPAGYFIKSIPGLDGLGDGVDVNFA